MGGRGANSSGGATGGLKESDILSTRSLISERGANQALVDEALGVFSNVYDEYGSQVNDIQIAVLKSGSGAIAYYDSEGNIAVNQNYFNKKNIERAYADTVKSGFHPSNGNKTAMEAVVAHELGHKLTADVGAKMGEAGFSNLDSAAGKIVAQARAQTGHRSNSSFARKISGYAKHSNAETVAEAFSDVYCNGNRAKRESRAVVNVINSYLKGAK